MKSNLNFTDITLSEWGCTGILCVSAFETNTYFRVESIFTEVKCHGPQSKRDRRLKNLITYARSTEENAYRSASNKVKFYIFSSCCFSSIACSGTGVCQEKS